jgi:hypothetical protein
LDNAKRYRKKEDGDEWNTFGKREAHSVSFSTRD